MSTFEVNVTRIRAIEPIPNADAIELAVIGEYRSVVRKNQFSAGQLAAYIPESALVPLPVLQALGLEGKLAGSGKNRVKAAKFRGCLSQGILYPVDSGTDVGHPLMSLPLEDDGHSPVVLVTEGQDVAVELGIVKWEPPIPFNMSGEVYAAGQHLTVAFDVENYKKFPDLIANGEPVNMTEKIHGTFCGLGILPATDVGDKHFRGRYVIFSKGLGAQGLCFKDVPSNQSNVYVRALTTPDASGVCMLDRLNFLSPDEPIFILGEVFGPGVQDLCYGTELKFRAFDVCVGYRGNQEYLDRDEFEDFCTVASINTVPLLYRGPFSKAVLDQYTSGTETVSGNNTHLREGVVVRLDQERACAEIGRVMLKSVSEAYLLRKNPEATEYT